MSSIFCTVDDKHVPFFRVLWIADVPHFCGEPDCIAEGRYEIRLEHDESVWANAEERDNMLASMEVWWKRTQGLDEDDWE